MPLSKKFWEWDPGRADALELFQQNFLMETLENARSRNQIRPGDVLCFFRSSGRLCESSEANSHLIEINKFVIAAVTKIVRRNDVMVFSTNRWAGWKTGEKVLLN